MSKFGYAPRPRFFERLRDASLFSFRKLDFIGLFSLVLTLFWMLSLAMLNGNPLLPSLANPDHMVVFTAKWCASCNTLVPGVESVSRRLQIPFTVIDVDATTAPGAAQNFGLAIPRTNLPQAYYIRGEEQTLVLNGQLFRPNEQGRAKSELERNIRSLR